ncbi:hypothetical protein M0804_000475 [Polistes exclamans]|nr:hypothetical protein M0804_000475 [Polistes exclamans]
MKMFFVPRTRPSGFSTHAPGPVSLTYRSRRNPLYSQLLFVIGNAHGRAITDALCNARVSACALPKALLRRGMDEARIKGSTFCSKLIVSIISSSSSSNSDDDDDSAYVINNQ